MTIKIFTNGIVIDTLPCNWCGAYVEIDDNGCPASGYFKAYSAGVVIYCSGECSVREYDYLYQHNPESISVNLPLSPECQELMINH